MYNDFYHTTITTTSGVDGTWVIISAVLAIVGGICGYALFVANKNNKKYTGFLEWLHNFLNFKKLLIEIILKVMYLMTAIFITLSSFSLIGSSIAGFFLYLILGNVIARVSYEMILMIITIVNNTTEINKKLPSLKEDDAEKKAKKITKE